MTSKPGQFVFEPHNLSGQPTGTSPGDDFPFGYISRIAKNGIPSPLFEVRWFLGTKKEAEANIKFIIDACNARHSKEV